jgi:hypothetical protein
LRRISPPTVNAEDLFITCVNSISNMDLRARLLSLLPDITNAAIEYSIQGHLQSLYTIAACNVKDEDIVIGQVTKKELKSTYSDHMAPQSKPARNVYDLIMATAPRRRCPFCGLGVASTLDHYLPKAKFPLLSVTPLNLVPACKDCNHGKQASIATEQSKQTLHPYFDREELERDQWLFADLSPTTPPVLEFKAIPPHDWPAVDKQRVITHFESYGLDVRFSVESSNELASLREILSILWESDGVDGVRDLLTVSAQGKRRQHANSWETAMFQALAGSDWYCDGGFRDFD